MSNLKDISFDVVMRKANESRWKRLKETRESKDTYYTCLLYYSEVGNFYVVLNNFYSGGIFWRRLHKIDVTDNSDFKGSFCVSYPIITFKGNKYSSEGGRRERTLRTLESNLNKHYNKIDRQNELAELNKKKREEKEFHNNLRKTFE